MEILRASEDYLESMLMMKLKHGYIRSIDVAEHLGVTKPSVTYATRRLKESGHITMDKDGLITLTETGISLKPIFTSLIEWSLHYSHQYREKNKLSTPEESAEPSDEA